MMTRPSHTTTYRRALLGCIVLFTVIAASGCRQGPITENDERSPFDRYDLIRDEFALPYLQDEYGRKRPNLRGRLVDR